MKKLFAIASVFGLLAITASANKKECAYNCAVLDSSNEIIRSDQFDPIGGYTSDLNTLCTASIKKNNREVGFEVHDVFGSLTNMTISVDGVYTSAQAPGNKGIFSLRYGPLGLELNCYR